MTRRTIFQVFAGAAVASRLEAHRAVQQIAPVVAPPLVSSPPFGIIESLEMWGDTIDVSSLDSAYRKLLPGQRYCALSCYLDPAQFDALNKAFRERSPVQWEFKSAKLALTHTAIVRELTVELNQPEFGLSPAGGVYKVHVHSWMVEAPSKISSVITLEIPEPTDTQNIFKHLRFTCTNAQHSSMPVLR